MHVLHFARARCFAFGGITMHVRTLLGIGLSASLCVFGSGCGLLGALNGTTDTSTSFGKEIEGFGNGNLWSTDSDSPRFMSTSVEVPGDLLENAPDPANLVFSSGVGKFSGDTLRGLRPDNASGGPGHTSFTFHFSRTEQDACDSDVVVGPFELSLADGTVATSVESLPLDAAVLGIARKGRFFVCAEVWSDFNGTVPFGSATLAFGTLPQDGNQVEICHVTGTNPDERHTIVVASSAVEAHMRHDDEMGPCSDEPPSADDSDSDGDGVLDAVDECPDTPAGIEVGLDGCTVIVLQANAGPDMTVVAGDPATASGSATVVQGDVDPAGLVFSWEQTGGTAVPFASSSPPLNVDTTGVEGVFSFRLTVSTPDGATSAFDDFILTVVRPQIVALSSSKWHNVALWNNHKITSWGSNRRGQIGDGTLVRGVAAVDTGLNHTVVVKTDGTVWTYGQNALSASAAATQVPGINNAVQVAALVTGAVLLDVDGTVWGFSDGFGGYCDLAGTASVDLNGHVTAVPIAGLPADTIAISAGARHGMAIDANGTAWVWGSRFGCTPWPVMENVAEVSAGETDLCLFRLNDGTVWAMGYNVLGQLGNATGISSYHMPTQVVGVSDAVAIAAGDRHSAFLTGDGTLYMAGWNRYCQLGLEDEAHPAAPQYGHAVAIPTAVGLTDFALVSGGYLHTIAVRGDNSVWAWGLNNLGQLSGGTLTALGYQVCTPMQVVLAE